MNRNKISILMFWMIVISFTFTQCRKEASLSVTPDPVVIPPVVTPVVIPDAAEVNTFIWSNMHDLYYWNDKVPNLSNTYYQMLTTTSPSYKRNKDSLNVFLNKYTDPSKLFKDLLYQYNVVDKWSFIVSDYTIIDNWIAGISKTMGCDFGPYYYTLDQTSSDVFVVVRYVLKNSPADLAGIQRGDIISKVDGAQLTGDNINNLLNGDSFTLSVARVVNGVMTLTGKTASLTAVQMQENPILFSNVFPINGSKVGYLVYNGFTSDFDLDLNLVFQQFKTAGVSKLILDLRYNGGGSVQTAVYLASMIYSTNTSKLFTKSVYNSFITPYITSAFGASFFLDNFTDNIITTVPNSITEIKTPINTLNLSDVYFIVSKETASASELLINGLKPYMNVKSIGTNTYGKYVASQTLKDYDSNNNLVTTHKYAMQPIVAVFANSLGVTEFVNGLAPDITAQEDGKNLLPWGDENETLLKVALDNIKGLKSQTIKNVSYLVKSGSLFGSKDKSPFSHDMYVDPQKLVKRNR